MINKDEIKGLSLTIILVFLIGFMAMSLTINFTILQYLIGQTTEGASLFEEIRWFMLFFECGFIILLFAFSVYILVEPAFFVLSKRKEKPE